MVHGITSPPNARVAAMTSMRTNNFKTLRLTNTYIDLQLVSESDVWSALGNP